MEKKKLFSPLGSEKPTKSPPSIIRIESSPRTDSSICSWLSQGGMMTSEMYLSRKKDLRRKGRPEVRVGASGRSEHKFNVSRFDRALQRVQEDRFGSTGGRRQFRPATKLGGEYPRSRPEEMDGRKGLDCALWGKAAQREQVTTITQLVWKRVHWTGQGPGKGLAKSS